MTRKSFEWDVVAEREEGEIREEEEDEDEEGEEEEDEERVCAFENDRVGCDRSIFSKFDKLIPNLRVLQ